MAKLAARAAVVTGGGSGIGRAIVLCFAAEGARVAVVDIVSDEASFLTGQVVSPNGGYHT